MTRFKCIPPHTGQAFILSFSINYLSKIKCCLERQDNTIPEFGAKKQIKSDGLGFR